MSQEKLTLEHLAAYLPYKVEVEYKLPEWVEVQISKISMISSTHLRVYLENYNYSGWIENYKLRLRPLSDLTKEIEHNGEKFVPIAELLKIKHKGWVIEKLNTRYSEIDCEINNNYAKAHFRFMASLSIDVWLKNLENQDYWIVQKLLSWHFDVFGLIPKGLAVSIHDLG